MSLGALLDRAATGDTGLVVIDDDGSRTRLTWAELRRRALARLAVLHASGARPGDRIVIAHDAPLALLTELWAALYGRIEAVPLTPPTRPSERARLSSLASLLGDPWISTDLPAAALAPAARRLPLDHLDASDAPAPSRAPTPCTSHDVAFIQLSSGSTGDPKGIVLTHANVLANAQDITRRARFSPADRTLLWMPLTHDMGLVGSHLAPLVLGCEQIVMRPRTFVTRPALWLEAASHHRATLLTSPSMGLVHALKHIAWHALGELDLASVRVLCLGADPLDPAVIRAFLDRTRKLGLAPEAVFPVYGLAEAAVAVTFPDPGQGLVTTRVDRRTLAVGARPEPGFDELTLLGRPLDQTALRIVDDAGAELAPGTVGRIQIRGANVAQASVGRALPRDAEGWLDTEDLGFLADGALAVCGRAKDLVFVLGHNVFLHDVDRVASAVAGREAAACALGDDALAVFVKAPCNGELASRVSAALASELGLVPRFVTAIERLPKTPSGKVRRHALAAHVPADLAAADGDEPLARIRAAIATVAPALDVDVDTPFLEAGLTSLALVEVAARLGLAPVVPFQHPTMRRLAAQLSRSTSPGPPSTHGAAAIAPPIAIVGMAARAASAPDLHALWAALIAGEDLVAPLAPRRLADLERAARARGLAFEPALLGGYLPEIADFDPAACGLGEAEATLLHPQHRLLFDLLVDALDSAGPANAGPRTGIWVGHIGDLDGGAWRDRVRLGAADRRSLALPGHLGAFLAGRPAHVLGLDGPAVVVDTACSASLAALHAACQALRAGECERALVASARVALEPLRWPTEFGFESSSGRCRSFSVAADGIALGEGGAALVLEPLDQALAAGRRVWAVIRGSALGHDGQAARLGAPNPQAQAEVVRRAWSQAGLSPSHAAFIEAHGAGTPLGDAIEIEALAAAGLARPTTPTPPTPIGSIKSNVGHLFEAAGLLGVVKASLALTERRLPPSLHADAPVGALAAAHLSLPRMVIALPEGPLRAGVTALGFSGTSAHVVLESAPVGAGARLVDMPRPRARKPRRLWIDLPEVLPAAPVSRNAPHRARDLAVIRRDLAQLVQRFSDVKLDEPGWSSSFFSLGLDSLVLIQLRQAIEARFSVALPMARMLADLATPEALARWLAETDPLSPVASPPVRTQPEPPRAARRPEPALAAPELAGALDRMMRGSKAHAEATRPYLANNRNVAGLRPAWKELIYPPVARRASGAWFEDVDGRAVLDLAMGFGVQLFGHDPPFVREALARCLDDGGLFLGPLTPVAAEVAERLTRLTRTERVAFYNSGTEAVMVALRLARAVTGRQRIVTFAGSYHGSHDQVLAVAGPDGRGLAFAPGIPDDFVRETVVLDYGRPESLERIHRDRAVIAAVLVEPVQSRRPDLQPERFVRELAALTREHGMALVFDEVVTGFRAAPGGVRERFGVDCDLVVYGKVLGGGLPIGAVAGRAAFMDAIDGGAWSYGDASLPSVPTTFVAGTFCQHPLAMAAARAVLERLESAGPALQLELERQTGALVQRLRALMRERELPIEVSAFSSQMRFFARGPAELFFWELLREGVYVWEGRTAFWSTAHGDAEAERVVAAATIAADRVAHRARARVVAPGPDATAPGITVPYTTAQVTTLAAARANVRASIAQHQSLLVRLHGALDLASLGRAWDALARSHEALGVYAHDDGLVLGATPSRLIDLGDSSLDALTAALDQPFDLDARTSLARALIAREPSGTHVFGLVLHRLIGDGWSLGLLLASLLTTPTPPVPLATLNAALAAIEGRGAGAPPPRVRPLVSGPPPPYAASTTTRRLDAGLARAAARRQGLTPFSALLTTLAEAIFETTGVDALSVALPIAGQPVVALPYAVGHATRLAPLTLERAAGAGIARQVERGLVAILGGDFTDLSQLPHDPTRPRPSVVFNLDRVPPLDLAHARHGVTGVAWLTAPHAFTAHDLVVQALDLPTAGATSSLLTEWKYAAHLDPIWVGALADRFVTALAKDPPS